MRRERRREAALVVPVGIALVATLRANARPVRRRHEFIALATPSGGAVVTARG